MEPSDIPWLMQWLRMARFIEQAPFFFLVCCKLEYDGLYFQKFASIHGCINAANKVTEKNFTLKGVGGRVQEENEL